MILQRATYSLARGVIVSRSAAAGLERVPCDPVLTDVVTVSSPDYHPGLAGIVLSGSRQESHPAPVTTSEPAGPQGTQPRVVS